MQLVSGTVSIANQNLEEVGKVEGPEKCNKEGEHNESKYVQPLPTRYI